MEPAQGRPCHVGSRPVPGGGAVGYCVPYGWSGLLRCLGAQRPGGPPARRGPHFSREMGRKRAGGGAPWTPSFMARSLPLAGFGGCAALFRWWGYFAPHLRALIWNAFSCRIARPRGFPSGGSYHRRGRMRGRPGCPTGQEKKPVGATGSNPLFYKERLGTKSPPHPPQCAHWGTFPPSKH